MKSKFSVEVEVDESETIKELRRQLHVYQEIDKPRLLAQIEKMRRQIMGASINESTVDRFHKGRIGLGQWAFVKEGEDDEKKYYKATRADL